MESNLTDVSFRLKVMKAVSPSVVCFSGSEGELPRYTCIGAIGFMNSVSVPLYILCLYQLINTI